MRALYLEIVNEIESQLDDEILQVGEKLPSERELADKFNVSRNVVREAISVLRAKGLISVHAGRGAYVIKPNPTMVTETMERISQNYNTTIEDILEVREELENSIIKKVVRTATPDDIQKLYDLYNKMEKDKRDVDKYVKLDVRFHMALAQCTKNPLFYILLNTFTEMTQSVLFAFTTVIPDSVAQAQEQHLALIKAIENGDENVAQEVLISHMQVLRGNKNSQGKRIIVRKKFSSLAEIALSKLGMERILL